MYLQSLHLTNVKGIKEFHLNLKGRECGWHVLLGENGSGKTTILRSIALTLLPLALHSYFQQDWKKWNYRMLDSGSLMGNVSSVLTYDSILDKVLTNPRNRIIIGSINFESWSPTHTFLSSGGSRSAEKAIFLHEFWDPSKGWFSAGFGAFRQFAQVRTEEILDPNMSKAAAHLSLFNPEALANAHFWIRELDDKRLREKEKNPTATSAAGLTLEKLKYLINSGEHLLRNTTFAGVNLDGELEFLDPNGVAVTVNELSDGYRSILSIVFELIRQMIQCYGFESVFPNESAQNSIDLPGVVLIDEVDAHLHPSWQVKIGEWFYCHFSQSPIHCHYP
jgi:hypothetical protein